MSYRLYIGAGIGVGFGLFACLRLTQTSELAFEPHSERIEAEPLCPWREPQRDLAEFFPTAVRYETETRVLSGCRTVLAERLGRPPTAGENVLCLYSILGPGSPLGRIVTGRVKGEYGAVELVVAVKASGELAGLRVQRWREPEAIVEALEQPEWLAAFRGKTAASKWDWETDWPRVVPAASATAKAMVAGVRSLLILLDVASQTNAAPSIRHH